MASEREGLRVPELREKNEGLSPGVAGQGSRALVQGSEESTPPRGLGREPHPDDGHMGAMGGSGEQVKASGLQAFPVLSEIAAKAFLESWGSGCKKSGDVPAK